MGICDRLKIARESLGKSQKEMAEFLEIGLKSWQVYEQGSSYPGGKVFESLVKLGFNANWLLTGEGDMNGGDKAEQSPRTLPRMTATGRMAKAMDEQLKGFLAAQKIQNERYLEIAILVEDIYQLDYDNVFKLSKIAEDMLNLQKQEMEG